MAKSLLECQVDQFTAALEGRETPQQDRVGRFNFQVRTHKKKRIDKKWRNRYGIVSFSCRLGDIRAAYKDAMGYIRMEQGRRRRGDPRREDLKPFDDGIEEHEFSRIPDGVFDEPVPHKVPESFLKAPDADDLKEGEE